MYNHQKVNTMKAAAVWSIVLLCAGPIQAQEFMESPPPEGPPPEIQPKAVPQAPAATDNAAKTEAVYSSEESSGGGILRDPFWPVGYIPEGAVVEGTRATKDEPTSGIPQWADAMKQLHLSGIMKTGQEGYVAMVNGQAVSEGDTISVFFSGRNYTWKVRAISPKNVDFAQLSVQ